MATRFKITQSKEEIIAMTGALPHDHCGLGSVDKMPTERIKQGGISRCGIRKSAVDPFTLARNDFADIELFRNELALQLAPESARAPPEAALRPRADFNSRPPRLDYARRDRRRRIESFETVNMEPPQLIPLDIGVAALLNPGCLKEGMVRTGHKIAGCARCSPVSEA